MNLIAYQIEVAICLSVFYIIYYIFLRYETFFNVNRYILVSAIVLSFIIPLIEIPSVPISIPYVEPLEIEYQINEVTIYAQKSIQSSTNIYQYIPLIYYLGIIISLGILLIGFVKLYILFRKSTKIQINGNTINLLDTEINPFTFFNRIFVSRKLYETANINSIINHELVHKNHKHSLDILIVEILKSFQWFNPIIYLLSREIREVHEYIADSNAIKYEEKSNYVDILLNLTIGAQVSDLANNFNGIKLIKRLKMISKPKSAKSAVLKYLMILPALIVLFLAFSCKENIGETNGNGEDYKDIYPDVVQKDDEYIDYDTGYNGLKVQKVDERAEYIPESNYYDFHIKILSKMKLDDELTNTKKAMKVFIRYKVDKNGKISMPIITNYKYADDKSWSQKRLPKDIENEIFNAILKADFKLKPAIKDGQNVDSYSGVMLFIGDENTWNEHNLGKEVFSVDSKREYMQGVEIPYSKVDDSKRTGKSLLKNEHLNYILNNLKYPEAARKKNIEGTVIIDFKVDANGNVIDAKVEDGIGYGCDEEALRVVKELKNFEPNKKFDGETNLKLPIKFKLKY